MTQHDGPPVAYNVFINSTVFVCPSATNQSTTLLTPCHFQLIRTAALSPRNRFLNPKRRAPLNPQDHHNNIGNSQSLSLPIDVAQSCPARHTFSRNRFPPTNFCRIPSSTVITSYRTVPVVPYSLNPIINIICIRPDNRYLFHLLRQG